MSTPAPTQSDSNSAGSPPIRVIFIGTAPLAVPSLQALIAAPDFSVVAAVTQPDRPQGRKLQLQPSAVKTCAMEHSIPVLQPERVRHESSLAALRALDPDLIVVAAYGQILPKALLDLPRHGCLNVHTSLLPRHRGAAPIQWALLEGDAETGVTIMQMDPGLDTGPILTQQITPITESDNAITVHDRLAVLGAELLLQTARRWVAGTVSPVPQPDAGTTYARKIEKVDGLLDWSLSANRLWNRVRGLVPWPGAHCHRTPDGAAPAVLKVWEALPATEVQGGGVPGQVLSADAHGIVIRCGEGALRLLVMQREGGKRLPVREFLAGCPVAAGEIWRNPGP